MRPAAWLLQLAFVWLAGCSSCGGEPEQTSPAATKKPEQPAPELASVTGTVRLAEGAELPRYAADFQDVAQKGLAAQEPRSLPEQCAPPKIADRQPVALGDARGLSNVLVAASEFKASIERAPATHEVVIDDCRLTPPVVAAQQGDRLRIRNETAYPFMPKLPTDPFMQALVEGQSRDVVLERGGVQPLTCGFSDPCGRSDVIVLYHPVYALTEPDGTFRIDNFPAGEPVTLNAWHPLFEQASVQVRVAPGETKQVELVLRRAAPQAAEEGDTPDADGPAANDTAKRGERSESSTAAEAGR